MKIRKFLGDSHDVYNTIAPLTMSPNVAKYFDNRSITTSNDYEWYVCEEKRMNEGDTVLALRQ